VSKPRPVDKYTLDGQFIRSFDKVIDAASDIDCIKSKISDVCNGEIRQVKGFRYAYKGEQLKAWIDSSTPLKHHKTLNKEDEALSKENNLLSSNYFGYFGNVGY